MNSYLNLTHLVHKNIFGGQDSVGLDGNFHRRSIPNIFGGHDIQDSHLHTIGFTHPMGNGLDDQQYGITDLDLDHGSMMDHHTSFTDLDS